MARMIKPSRVADSRMILGFGLVMVRSKKIVLSMRLRPLLLKVVFLALSLVFPETKGHHYRIRNAGFGFSGRGLIRNLRLPAPDLPISKEASNGQVHETTTL